MKETEEDTSKWRDISCSQIGRIHTVKKSADQMQSLSKFQLHFLQKQNKQCNLYGPKIAKAIIRKKNKVKVINPSDFELYPKTIIIKKVWY